MMRSPRFFAAGRAALAIALFGAAFAVTDGFLARPACAQAADLLDTNAKINVTVAGEADITADYIVDSTGNITMLYVNQIHVKGLTVAQAQTAITKKLKTVYRNPQVLVRLVNLGGIGVTVTGAVATPGERTVRADSHLNDLLQTDAPTVLADLTAVEITHGLPGQTHTTEVVNYSRFLSSQTADGNPQLLNGDVIFVRQKDAAPIQVGLRGQVMKTGTMTLPAKSTLIDAIQAAGGLTASADPKSILLQHTSDTVGMTLDYSKTQLNPADVSVNPILQDGDTVVVKGTDKPSIYTLTGGVEHPGEYPLPETPITLADALGKAGGVARYAKLKQTTILRTGSNGSTQVFQVNASDLNVQAHTIIQVGDNISIPPGDPPAQKLNPLTLISVFATLYGIFGRRR